MSKLILYGADPSPPVRACLLTLNALEVLHEYKVVNLLAGEHMSEDFLKHNPQHTVPVLDDNGTWLYDSHAICAYLVQKYGKSDELYPKDLAKRALVNQRLHFESGILFAALRNVSHPLFRHNLTVVAKEKADRVIEGYVLMETFLAKHSYIAGEALTIADFSCAATVVSLSGIIPIDGGKYPKLLAWLERLSKLPYYENANAKGGRIHIQLIRTRLTQIEL